MRIFTPLISVSLVLGALLAGNHADPPEATLEPGDLASILYTSGTTGMPKGVMNCHNSYEP